MLADGTAFRVRVWSPSGDLLFSTDAGDESDAVSSDLDAVYAATRGTGRLNSITTDDGAGVRDLRAAPPGRGRLARSGRGGSGYERIATSAASPWSLLRTIGLAGAVVMLLLVVVASLPGVGSRTGGFISPSREIALAKQRARSDEAVIRAEERARVAEEHAHEIEQRARDAETREREAEARASRAESDLEAAQAEMERLRKKATEAGSPGGGRTIPTGHGASPRGGRT